jgi:hypothetical protein
MLNLKWLSTCCRRYQCCKGSHNFVFNVRETISKVPGQRCPNDGDMERLKADCLPEHVVGLDELHAQQSAPGRTWMSDERRYLGNSIPERELIIACSTNVLYHPRPTGYDGVSPHCGDFERSSVVL